MSFEKGVILPSGERRNPPIASRSRKLDRNLSWRLVANRSSDRMHSIPRSMMRLVPYQCEPHALHVKNL
jgi:hypothetical protein